MRIEYDPEVDVLYVQFRPAAPGQVESRALSDDITADYAPDGRLVGLEILDASLVLGEESSRVIVEVASAKSGARRP